MPNQEPMIKVQDVRFRYDPEQPKYAVDGVSLDIRRGEFVAVLGANGCGKSTLAKHFNAILLPEAGTVLVEGMDTRNEDHLYDVRQKVGMVFQNPDNQIVATIVEEDVAFAPENLGVPPEEIRTRIDEAMKLAGIYEKREAAPYKLSGGQKQRVAIAGVIAMRPDCLVMDESTAMLDPHGRAQVMKTIRQLRAAGITIVSITHYMEEAAQADRVLVMSRGRIVMEGTPEQVFSQTERLHGYHLDVPQAAELRDDWMHRDAYCKIAKVGAVEKKLRRRRDDIIAAVELGISNGRVEAINNKIKVAVRMGYGFRNTDNLVALLMLRCGDCQPQLPGRPVKARKKGVKGAKSVAA